MVFMKVSDGVKINLATVVFSARRGHTKSIFILVWSCVWFSCPKAQLILKTGYIFLVRVCFLSSGEVHTTLWDGKTHQRPTVKQPKMWEKELRSIKTNGTTFMLVREEL